MKFYYDVIQKMQEYLVTGDEGCLLDAADILEEERINRTLQDTHIILDNMSIKEMENCVQNSNFIKISTKEITNVGGDIIVDDYIRVVDKNHDFQSALILKVAHLDDNWIILVPYVPMNSSSEE